MGVRRYLYNLDFQPQEVAYNHNLALYYLNSNNFVTAYHYFYKAYSIFVNIFGGHSAQASFLKREMLNCHEKLIQLKFFFSNLQGSNDQERARLKAAQLSWLKEIGKDDGAQEEMRAQTNNCFLAALANNDNQELSIRYAEFLLANNYDLSLIIKLLITVKEKAPQNIQYSLWEKSLLINALQNYPFNQGIISLSTDVVAFLLLALTYKKLAKHDISGVALHADQDYLALAKDYLNKLKRLVVNENNWIQQEIYYHLLITASNTLEDKIQLESAQKQLDILILNKRKETREKAAVPADLGKMVMAELFGEEKLSRLDNKSADINIAATKDSLDDYQDSQPSQQHIYQDVADKTHFEEKNIPKSLHDYSFNALKLYRQGDYYKVIELFKSILSLLGYKESENDVSAHKLLISDDIYFINLQPLSLLLEEDINKIIIKTKTTIVETELLAFYYLMQCSIQLKDTIAAARYRFALDFFANKKSTNKEVARQFSDSVSGWQSAIMPGLVFKSGLQNKAKKIARAKPGYPTILFTLGVCEKNATAPQVVKVLEKIAREETRYDENTAGEVAKRFCEWARFHHRHFKLNRIKQFMSKEQVESIFSSQKK